MNINADSYSIETYIKYLERHNTQLKDQLQSLELDFTKCLALLNDAAPFVYGVKQKAELDTYLEAHDKVK